ncbi:MAG: hypothetical protein WC736_15280 [Gallionella sp.]|jgi:hypothetical protein
MMQNISTHVGGFVGSIAALPIVAELTPEGAQGILAGGNAQAILALVAVVESLIIYKLFLGWRADVDKQTEKTIALNQKVNDSLDANTAVLKEMTASMLMVNNTIDKCKGASK